MSRQELTDKENHGVPEKRQNEKPQGVVSILKSSQKQNFPLVKKLTKVSGCDTWSVIAVLYSSYLRAK